jgi:hypothetical protein
MANTTFNKATNQLVESVRDTNQTIVESAVAAQKRNLWFAQGIWENGIEILRSNAKDTRHLIETVTEQPQTPQDGWQAVLNTTVAVQERNIRFAETVLQGSTDLLKSHAEATTQLWQTVAEQSQRQQEAVQTVVQAFLNGYVDLLRAPFSFYQQAIQAAESIAQQGVNTAQRVARQTVEAAESIAQQGVDTAEHVAHEGAENARKTARQAQKNAE